MFSKNFKVQNFTKTKVTSKLKLYYRKIIEERNNKKNILNSMTKSYNYSFNRFQIKKLNKYNNVIIFGMGGSSLGSQAIYEFMKFKIKKNFFFYNNLDKKNEKIKDKYKEKSINIIISKSGGTLETIVNENLFSKKEKFYITEKTKNYLRKMASILKSEVIEHKNFIGGRYSVLSEVGMLPAELMGLNSKKFKQLNNLILKKNFEKNLLNNVSSIYKLASSGKTNSIILNYDESSYSFFKWYQQLVAESLGKNSKGILPIISDMPRDNHSLMQLYLAGTKNCFYTFFDVLEKKSSKINNKLLLSNFKFLKNHNLNSIKNAQKNATKKVFRQKKIPFRSFEIKKKARNA